MRLRLFTGVRLFQTLEYFFNSIQIILPVKFISVFHNELTIKKILCCVLFFYLQYSKNMNFTLSLDFGAISFLFVPIRCDKVCGLLLGLLACLADWVLSVSVSLPVKLVFQGLKPVVGQRGHNQRYVSSTYIMGLLFLIR